MESEDQWEASLEEKAICSQEVLLDPQLFPGYSLRYLWPGRLLSSFSWCAAISVPVRAGVGGPSQLDYCKTLHYFLSPNKLLVITFKVLYTIEHRTRILHRPPSAIYCCPSAINSCTSLVLIQDGPYEVRGKVQGLLGCSTTHLEQAVRRSEGGFFGTWFLV